MVTTLEAIALRRQLTASRMKPLFLIVQRNAQFWLRSPFPASRGYVQFRGSQMLFEYYVGKGLQLQPLANFKKANALHGACVKPTAGVACNRAALARLLDEMVATRVRRGRFTAYEYYFDFGGRPPWISGMATATGIQAFGRAGQLLNTEQVAPVRHRGDGRVHHARPHRRADARAAGRHPLPAVLDVARACTSPTRCCSR